MTWTTARMLLNWPTSDLLFDWFTGCSPVLDGSSNAQNGLEGDDDHEEYTLMSIDTIINGKVA